LASFSSPAQVFEQLSVIYALPRLFVASFTLVLPFFPTGSMERMEEEGDVATAFTLARMLSNIPISRGGPTSLVIYDIHALQVCVFNAFKESSIIGILYLRSLCSTNEKDPYELLSNNTIKLMNFSL
jgi:phosphoribosylpyrophosphate synthetase